MSIRPLRLLRLTLAGAALLAVTPVSPFIVPAMAAAPAGDPAARLALAADKIEIMELAAHFDNGLDGEDEAKFVGTFVPDGVLAGFWGEATGPEQIGGAFHFMLSTFAKNRHHVVTNHEIAVTGDNATMFSYLTVFDRATLTIIGTASFTDQLIRTSAGWRFQRRTLSADANVQPLIDALPKS